MRGIFISYRREDSRADAGRLHDALVKHFGGQNIFFDVDSIAPGEDFREVIDRTFLSCDILLAVIGRQWAKASDMTGRLRLENPRDTLRVEIASALQKGLRVVPVLVGGAEMPREEELPEDIRPLVYRNAWDISDKRFHQDVQLLVDALQKSASRPARAAVEADSVAVEPMAKPVEREQMAPRPPSPLAQGTTSRPARASDPPKPSTTTKRSSKSGDALVNFFLFAFFVIPNIPAFFAGRYLAQLCFYFRQPAPSDVSQSIAWLWMPGAPWLLLPVAGVLAGLLSRWVFSMIGTLKDIGWVAILNWPGSLIGYALLSNLTRQIRQPIWPAIASVVVYLFVALVGEPMRR